MTPAMKTRHEKMAGRYRVWQAKRKLRAEARRLAKNPPPPPAPPGPFDHKPMKYPQDRIVRALEPVDPNTHLPVQVRKGSAAAEAYYNTVTPDHVADRLDELSICQLPFPERPTEHQIEQRARGMALIRLLGKLASELRELDLFT